MAAGSFTDAAFSIWLHFTIFAYLAQAPGEARYRSPWASGFIHWARCEARRFFALCCSRALALEKQNDLAVRAIAI
jgi:hypothetical protein